jgi:hypothetical protein
VHVRFASAQAIICAVRARQAWERCWQVCAGVRAGVRAGVCGAWLRYEGGKWKREEERTRVRCAGSTQAARRRVLYWRAAGTAAAPSPRAHRPARVEHATDNTQQTMQHTAYDVEHATHNMPLSRCKREPRRQQSAQGTQGTCMGTRYSPSCAHPCSPSRAAPRAPLASESLSSAAHPFRAASTGSRR